MTKNLPRLLPLREIAQRISAHLHKMEVDKKYNKADPKHHTRLLYGAGSGVYGSKVGVTYVTYQGHLLLTREEALSYLAGLDAGYRGEHYLWLEKHPVAKKLPEVKFRALIKTRFFSYALYDVTNLTTTRVYGRRVPREEYEAALGEREFSVGFVGAFEDRKQLLTRWGTMAMLKKLLTIETQRGRAHAAVDREYAVMVRDVIGVADQEEEL